MFNKSNLEILQDIKKEYKPNNAFGNVKLIKLLDNIRKPNKDGLFEPYAVVLEFQENDVIGKTCSCGKEHKLTIAKD